VSNEERLSSAEEEQLISLLSRLQVNAMPTRVFNVLATKVALTGISAAILDARDGGLDILLTQRPLDDPWAGQWHMPGSIVRPTDAPDEIDVEGNYDAAFRRIEKEIKTPFITPPRFIGKYFHRGTRGTGTDLIFICEVEECEVGEYFPVDALPEKVIGCHRPMIERAVAAYRAGK
jgi:hypothetical protein